MVKTKAKLFQTVEVLCDTEVQYTEHFQRLQLPWHLCDKLGERARAGWRLPPEPSAFQVPLHKQRLQSHTIPTASESSLPTLSYQPAAHSAWPMARVMTRLSAPCLHNKRHPYSFPVPKEQSKWWWESAVKQANKQNTQQRRVAQTQGYCLLRIEPL